MSSEHFFIRRRKIYRLRAVVLMMFTGLFFLFVSCRNDVEEVKKITRLDSLPYQTAKGIELLYSEYGDIIFKLTSPRVEKYMGDNPRMIFPDGMKVVFFDSTGNNIRSRLTANYGIKYDKKQRMIAKGNVVVKNFEKNERLNTEELIWDQRKGKIFTDKFVTITTEDEVLYGKEGMESDESFSSWVIKKPKGKMEYSEEELDSTKKNN
ncbi:MAG: LPS export ABC transporter periplasmic protein LptC [Bacteroidales bacterium]|nr:LPS export ABC transporter periplasmic protein LptC [Bacteroidales bacterium]MCF8333509.1 LPS export ABC transporter periplasmic protein LptC [Bacteroidales bacterium]